ncbi:unnamed protein product, partial [Polarella glacialis]
MDAAGLCSLLSVKAVPIQLKAPVAAVNSSGSGQCSAQWRSKSAVPAPLCGRSLRAALNFASGARGLSKPHRDAEPLVREVSLFVAPAVGGLHLGHSGG